MAVKGDCHSLERERRKTLYAAQQKGRRRGKTGVGARVVQILEVGRGSEDDHRTVESDKEEL